MNKEQFLAAVRERLTGLPGTDVNRFLDYCREMIDDRMEDGLSEEEAVAMMGSPEYVASQLLIDAPPAPAESPKVQTRRLKTWQAVLIILTCPVWITLLFGAAIAVFSLLVSVAATIFGLYCAAGGIMIGGVSLIIAAFLKFALPEALFLLAAGFLLIGIGLLMILGLNFLVCQLIRLGKWCTEKTRTLFAKKEAVS